MEQLENELEKVTNLEQVKKEEKMDDFFKSFEESMAKLVRFVAPKEGEDCELCSA